jgi:guanylate kinase
MLILTGPSASGKTEIAKILVNKNKLKKLVTYTTRPPRLGEVDGIDYHFVSVSDFMTLKDNDEFIETTYYNNNYYGSRKSDVSPEKVVILDPSGVNKFKECLKDKVVIVFLNTPEKLRVERMTQRGDSTDLIEKRIKNDRNTFTKDAYNHVDYTYKNEIINLESLAEEIYNTYIAHINTLKSNSK